MNIRKARAYFLPLRMSVSLDNVSYVQEVSTAKQLANLSALLINVRR
jgi:hypothetical protein